MVKKNLILPTDVFPNGLSEIKYARIRAVEKEYGVGRWTMFHALRGRTYEAEKQDHLDHPAPLDEDERASPSGRAALRLRAPLCREVPERDDE